MEDSRQEAPGQSEGDNRGKAESRPSLAERLMNPPNPESPRPEPERLVPDVPAQEALARTVAEEHQAPARERPMPPVGSRLPVSASSTSDLNQSLNEALREARRFIRIRYFIFLASVTVFFATVAVATVVLVLSLLEGARWEQQAASGAVAATALLLLILIQYRPAGSFESAAVEIAQMEVLRTHLDKSYSLWAEFLGDRASTGQVSANEVAMAVSSMTLASRQLVAALAEFVEPQRKSRKPIAQLRSELPTPTVPDPRRY